MLTYDGKPEFGRKGELTRNNPCRLTNDLFYVSLNNCLYDFKEGGVDLLLFLDKSKHNKPYKRWCEISPVISVSIIRLSSLPLGQEDFPDNPEIWDFYCN